MAKIFLLACVDNAPTDEETAKVRASLAHSFGEKFLEMGNRSFLVAAEAPILTKDISDKAGISDGDAGSYIVTPLDSYYGWANQSYWEWIDTFDKS